MNDSSSNPTVSLSLTVGDGNAALEFYSKAFGAEEIFRMPTPDGSVAHAEFMLGNSRVFLSEADPEWHCAPLGEGQMSSNLLVIAASDCDAAFARAVEAGATPLNEPKDEFWGVRVAMVLDPYGNRWSLAQQFEEVTPEEMMRRAQALFAENA